VSPALDAAYPGGLTAYTENARRLLKCGHVVQLLLLHCLPGSWPLVVNSVRTVALAPFLALSLHPLLSPHWLTGLVVSLALV